MKMKSGADSSRRAAQMPSAVPMPGQSASPTALPDSAYAQPQKP